LTVPRRRADAEQNRARIIEVARQHLVVSKDFKLNEIAKAAGVGQGTLYRHFATREALLAEVYRADVDALVAAAPRLLARHRPVEALARWFREVARYAKVKRGVFTAVTSQARTDLAGTSEGRIGDAIGLMLDAGKADGQIRSDTDTRDVILLLGCLTRLDESEWDTRADHLLDVILDGLRHHS
jgi:AcrR family transcriptional regulator